MNRAIALQLSGLGYSDGSYDYSTDDTPDSSPSIWDTITNTLTKASSVVSTGAGIVSNVNKITGNTSSGGAAPAGSSAPLPLVINSPNNAPLPPAQPKGLSTGAKIGIGVGGAAVLATIIYLAVPKKKKGVSGVDGVKHKGKKAKK
jgi:hypothetical protein